MDLRYRGGEFLSMPLKPADRHTSCVINQMMASAAQEFHLYSIIRSDVTGY